MSPRNEDFLFAQEAQRLGYASESQIEEGFLLQRRMLDELEIDERLGMILVKRGWIAEEQARRVYARIDAGGGRDEIEGYQILEKIGVGAMGTVYKARHQRLQRTVAIKILRRDLATEAIQVERLKEEARILASLEHPNVVRALDAGESGGFPFVVMEYVEGETLKQRIARKGSLPETEALRITRALADALERARRMGVVHRDVKPGNVIIARNGEPKLMDLGLAKGPVDTGLTQHGVTVGTPQYISPEQAQDPRRADTRSDIYSLGATLYAMLAGRPPFSGNTLAEILTKVLYEVPTPVRARNKEVTPEVGYLVERMMLKDPALRYRTPADVVTDVDAILDGRTVIPRGFTGNWEAFLLRRRIRRWSAVVAVMTVVLVALGVVFFGILPAQQRKKMRLEGAEAILTVLGETHVSAMDHEINDVERMLDRCLRVKEDYENYAPEGLSKLTDQILALKAERDVAYDLARAESEVADLIGGEDEKKAFDKAQLLLETVREKSRRVPLDSPTRAAVANRLAELAARSATELNTVRGWARRPAVESLDALLGHQEAYRRSLKSGFLPSPELREARDIARRSVDQLQAIRRDVLSFEQRFGDEGLAPRLALDTLAVDAVESELHTEHDRLRTQGRLRWRTLDEPTWISWLVVDAFVEARMKVVVDALRPRVVKCWDQVARQAQEWTEAGRFEDAIELLARFVNRAGAGYPSLASKAQAQMNDALDAQERAQTEAQKALVVVEDDVLRLLREGRPKAIRQRVDAALRADESPGHTQHVAILKQLADGLRALHEAALAGVRIGSRVVDVLLRDGSVVPQWEIVSADPIEASVTVRVRRSSPSMCVELADIAPEALLSWAAKGDTVLPGGARAVAHLAALPESELWQGDLRPPIEHLREAVAALREIEFDAHLFTRLDYILARRVEEQSDREQQIWTDLDQIRRHMNKGEWDDAFFYLRRLFSPEYALFRLTDAFESNLEQIKANLVRVEAEIANLSLAERLPGARIKVPGSGESASTQILLDFQSRTQLQLLRRPPAQALGIRTEHSDPLATESEGTYEYRFLLLGNAEGLIRDRPFAVPCVFDPARKIEVNVDLHTGDSPFFFAIDVDGLQVGVLSADPTSPAHRDRWRLPEDLEPVGDEKKAPTLDWYGRGRGVAFHSGNDFGDPRTWDWPKKGYGRNHLTWDSQDKVLGRDLFRFRPDMAYQLKVVRDGGLLQLFVREADGEAYVLVAEKEMRGGALRGMESDRNPDIHNGTGLIQILTWTPQAIDNLRIEGAVLKRWR